MNGAASQEEMNEHVSQTIQRGYQSIRPLLGKFKRSVSICGSGPSLKDSYPELTGDILACNSAIKFLLGKGYVPTYGMIWDASEVCVDFAIPHKDITYLLGARCHPKVYERLHGCKIISWHAGGDHNIVEFLTEQKVEDVLINGGSAAVTRALYLAHALGYTDLHIFGGDSSYEKDTHVTGESLVKEKRIVIDVGDYEGAPTFITTPELCGQVEEFKQIYPMFLSMGINITVHGHGMLSHIYSVLKQTHGLYRPGVIDANISV